MKHDIRQVEVRKNEWWVDMGFVQALEYEKTNVFWLAKCLETNVFILCLSKSKLE